MTDDELQIYKELILIKADIVFILKEIMMLHLSLHEILNVLLEDETGA